MLHQVMNENELIEIIKKRNIKDIQWKLEDSKESDLVFYKLYNTKDSLEKLLVKAQKASYGLLILNQVETLNSFEAIKNLPQVIFVKEDEWMPLQNAVLNLWYPLSDKDLKKKKIVGITGTNGKTTTSYLCQQIASRLGHKTAFVGSTGIHTDEGEMLTQSGLTTPPYIELRKLIHDLLFKKDYEALFLEVSSHALVTGRIYGIKFDAAAWTSFSQDHLDFHSDMEDYFKAKLLLPKMFLKKGAPFFLPQGEETLISKIQKEAVSLIKTRELDKDFEEEMPTFLKSFYNRKNFQIALEINYFLWGLTHQGKSSIKNIAGLHAAKGRFEVFEYKKRTVIIDSAHTPDAMEKLCLGVRSIYSKRRIILVFGCGGDRDPLKRPQMAKVAQKFADEVYITSDNPRFEDPLKILEDIEKGFDKNFTYHKYESRKEAISNAYKNLDEKSILIIAGKGPEEYQIIRDQKIHYNDFEYINEIKNLRVGSHLDANGKGDE